MTHIVQYNISKINFYKLLVMSLLTGDLSVTLYPSSMAMAIRRLHRRRQYTVTATTVVVRVYSPTAQPGRIYSGLNG